MVVLSQYVQHAYAADLLDSCDGRGIGYLLKDRVADVEEFITALRRVCSGGTVVDPQVISQLVRRRRDPLTALSEREREVLALIAEGRRLRDEQHDRADAAATILRWLIGDDDHVPVRTDSPGELVGGFGHIVRSPAQLTATLSLAAERTAASRSPRTRPQRGPGQPQTRPAGRGIPRGRGGDARVGPRRAD
jgi:hypothetical protein